MRSSQRRDFFPAPRFSCLAANIADDTEDREGNRLENRVQL